MKNLLLCLFSLCCFIHLFSADVNFTDSNLPLIVIDTGGDTIPDDPKITAHMGIIDNGHGQRNQLSDPLNGYDGSIGIELRGHTTIGPNWPKKGYGLETRNADGSNNNVSLFGMPRENDWVLHGPLMDKSLMRNALMNRLYRDMGHYTPRTQFVELVINGEYLGVYLFLEKIKADNNRVDISEPTLADLSGGYLLEMTTVVEDRIAPEDSVFMTSRTNKPIEVKYPKSEDMTPDQFQYISDYFNDFEEALYGPNFKDPISGFKAYIDMDSWIDHMLLSEGFGQLDIFRASMFFYKDKGTKLFLGPPWDFNRCMGNASYSTSWSTQNFWLSEDWTNQKADYYSRFSEDTAFMEQLKSRWKMLRLDVFSFDHIFSVIDEYTALLSEAKTRDFERWPNDLRCYEVHVCNAGFNEELIYMKNWTREKFLWLDAQFGVEFLPVINEINYHSSAAKDAGDWIEIYHPGDAVIHVGGFTLHTAHSGTPFVLPPGAKIDGGDYLVLCEDTTKFKSVFPAIQSYIGNFDFSLPDSGDLCQLKSTSGYLMDSVRYANQSPWPNSPDGQGPTLTLLSPGLDNALAQSWRASEQAGGTPGAANVRPLVTGLIINEIMAENNSTYADHAGDYDDWIEIRNTGTEPVDVGGLYVTDKSAMPLSWQIPQTAPDSTTIPAGGYLVLWADEQPEQGVLHVDIKLSRDSEQAGLVQKQGNAIHFLDLVSYPAQTTDMSYGRNPADTSQWVFMQYPTPGSVNVTSGTEFSAIDYFGDINNYYLHTPSHWQVTTLSGNRRLSLNSTDYQPLNENQLGEWSLILNRSYGDVKFICQAATAEDLLSNQHADYAVIFGYMNPGNYCYMLFSSGDCTQCNGLFAVISDTAESVKRFDYALITDTNFHTLEIERIGSFVKVSIDSVELLSVYDTRLGRAGHLGVGSLDDAVYFDEIDVEGEFTPGTDVDKASDGVPLTWALYQNYPNPFNPKTVISYSVPGRTRIGQLSVLSSVTVDVFDVSGHLVKQLFSGKQSEGYHEVIWDGKDQAGHSVSSGIYIYRLSCPEFSRQKKMIVLR